MVCETCTKKLGKIVTIDPYRSKAHNSGQEKQPSTSSEKARGSENKLLTAKKDNRYKPYAQSFEKCRICKHMVHQLGSHYCQQCAYQKGICSMCGKKLYETNRMKQTCV